MGGRRRKILAWPWRMSLCFLHLIGSWLRTLGRKHCVGSLLFHLSCRRCWLLMLLSSVASTEALLGKVQVNRQQGRCTPAKVALGKELELGWPQGMGWLICIECGFCWN